MDAPAQRMNDKLLCGSTVSEVREVLVGVVANQRGLGGKPSMNFASFAPLDLAASSQQTKMSYCERPKIRSLGPCQSSVRRCI
jgi:hypothetical protein